MDVKYRNHIMSKPSITAGLCALFLFISLVAFLAYLTTSDATIGAPQANSSAVRPHPVDDDMHHFMEYVFEPNYKRLKAAMADDPLDMKAWKAIKGDALTLAECANLLLMRAPDEDPDQWRMLSIAVRTHGGELYQAARNSDENAARRSYDNMLNNCNTCHRNFAGGEHQLQP